MLFICPFLHCLAVDIGGFPLLSLAFSYLIPKQLLAGLVAPIILLLLFPLTSVDFRNSNKEPLPFHWLAALLALTPQSGLSS